MLAAIRKELGGGLLFLQSRILFRVAGRRLASGITVTEGSPAELTDVRSRLNPGVPLRPSPPDPAVTNLVVARRGKVIGFVQLVRHPPSHAPFVGYWLFSLFVLDPLYRGTPCTAVPGSVKPSPGECSISPGRKEHRRCFWSSGRPTARRSAST